LVNTALFDAICPRCMIRKTDKKDDSGRIKLNPSKKTANLRWVNYNMREPVFLRLILCKENNKECEPKSCPCPVYKNMLAIKRICKSKEKMAHLYFRYENQKKINVGTRSCIVIFYKSNLNTDELVQRLKNTVKLLGIGKENFDFHVVPFCYEKISVFPSYRHKLKKEINSHYEGSRLKIEKNIQMNEKNELMILEIAHDNAAKEFSINTVVEDRESK